MLNYNALLWWLTHAYSIKIELPSHQILKDVITSIWYRRVIFLEKWYRGYVKRKGSEMVNDLQGVKLGGGVVVGAMHLKSYRGQNLEKW